MTDTVWEIFVRRNTSTYNDLMPRLELRSATGRHVNCLMIHNVKQIYSVNNVMWRDIPIKYKDEEFGFCIAYLYVYANLELNNFKITVVE